MKPKDGESVVLTLQFNLPAFWSDDLNRWVLDREGKLDSFPRNSPAIIAIQKKAPARVDDAEVTL